MKPHPRLPLLLALLLSPHHMWRGAAPCDVPVRGVRGLGAPPRPARTRFCRHHTVYSECSSVMRDCDRTGSAGRCGRSAPAAAAAAAMAGALLAEVPPGEVCPLRESKAQPRLNAALLAP